MSKLTEKIADLPAPSNARKGPRAACSIYGVGDIDDYQHIQQRHDNGQTWRSIQTLVDEALGIEQRIKTDLFRYHWTGKCAHWDGVELP